ncbi:PREDICTED: mitochondrial inner membrane protease subunit 1-like [Fragaria vesca subsp. vesca]|uniref:mitochondrial inner membrane protease subunit 1-like n=1 Tax=Fragaria vesca subsp. vesca TaxID=101020 RepID=UPI0002C2F509|nr:PREDICTED: mitochondrial inner membrane protease subunit 1-like [Fragaria vesca subsp. vesca]
MLPTFNSTGDIFLEERLSHRFGRLVPGDVVVVPSPDNPKMMVAKRIIGLEGDKVPKGHVWIQGDNTYESHDSRSHGPVPYGLIQGRVFCRVWPFDDFGFVRDQVAEGSGPVPNEKCSTALPLGLQKTTRV